MAKRDYEKFRADYPDATWEQITRNSWRYDTERVKIARGAAAQRIIGRKIVDLFTPFLDTLSKRLTN